MTGLLTLLGLATEDPAIAQEREALKQMSDKLVRLDQVISKCEAIAPGEAIRRIQQSSDELATANADFRRNYPTATKEPTVQAVAAAILRATQSIAEATDARDCDWSVLSKKDKPAIDKVLARRRDGVAAASQVLLDRLELDDEYAKADKQLGEMEKVKPAIDGVGPLRAKLGIAKLDDPAKADPGKVRAALVVVDEVKDALREKASASGGRVPFDKDAFERSDKAHNARLEQLKIKSKKPEEIAAENENATEEQRFKRLTEAEYLFNHPGPTPALKKTVAEHTAKLLHRASSVGLGDSEPLLVQYAYQLARGKADGDRAKMAELGKKLCERMVEKDLFGRYVGNLLTGSAAVEQLQKQDATKYYFWSLTNRNVDTLIATTKGEIVERLEKSAAAAMFDDLNFGQGWDDNAGNFRVIFEEISGAYAEKALQAAKASQAQSSSEPAIIVTALRGPNTGAVLGKTEWPALKKKITAEKLTFRFDVYHWGGSAKNFGVALPGYTIFSDPRFKLPCFDQNASGIARSLTTISDVDALIFEFEAYDEITQRGGPHTAGKGAGSSFAVMPTAFIDTKKNGLMLVGKKSANGTIFRLNDDGSERSETGLDEAAFLLKCDTDVIP